MVGLLNITINDFLCLYIWFTIHSFWDLGMCLLAVLWCTELISSLTGWRAENSVRKWVFLQPVSVWWQKTNVHSCSQELFCVPASVNMFLTAWNTRHRPINAQHLLSHWISIYDEMWMRAYNGDSLSSPLSLSLISLMVRVAVWRTWERHHLVWSKLITCFSAPFVCEDELIASGRRAAAWYASVSLDLKRRCRH